MQNPWALFALATLALPWLFLRRRRPTTPPPRVSFPAIRLLAPSLRRAVRRKERRLLVLAAIRSFALLTLVLIWAAPSPSFLSFFSDASSTPAESRLTIPLQRVAKLVQPSANVELNIRHSVFSFSLAPRRRLNRRRQLAQPGDKFRIIASDRNIRFARRNRSDAHA